MLNNKIKVNSVLIIVSLLFFSSCTRDVIELPEEDCAQEVTYNDQIQPVIATNCAYAGCHDGGGGAPGNFTNYSGMIPFLNSGRFESRAITQRNMPPSFASGPTSVTEEEFGLFICWMENGFKE